MTVQRHADALSGFPSEYQDAYKALSRLAASVLVDDPGAVLQELEGAFSPPTKRAEEKKARKKSAAG